MAADKLLKPCPFCGNKAYLVEKDRYSSRLGYAIVCDHCGIQFEGYGMYLSDMEIKTRWDRRAEPKRMCANCKHCGDYGVHSDIICLLHKNGEEYHHVCDDWVGKE